MLTALQMMKKPYRAEHPQKGEQGAESCSQPSPLPIRKLFSIIGSVIDFVHFWSPSLLVSLFPPIK